MALCHYTVGLPLSVLFAFGFHGGLFGLWGGKFFRRTLCELFRTLIPVLVVTEIPYRLRCRFVPGLRSPGLSGRI